VCAPHACPPFRLSAFAHLQMQRTQLKPTAACLFRRGLLCWPRAWLLASSLRPICCGCCGGPTLTALQETRCVWRPTRCSMRRLEALALLAPDGGVFVPEGSALLAECSAAGELTPPDLLALLRRVNQAAREPARARDARDAHANGAHAAVQEAVQKALHNAVDSPTRPEFVDPRISGPNFSAPNGSRTALGRTGRAEHRAASASPAMALYDLNNGVCQLGGSPMCSPRRAMCGVVDSRIKVSLIRSGRRAHLRPALAQSLLMPYYGRYPRRRGVEWRV
jgi:hypothetical protein